MKANDLRIGNLCYYHVVDKLNNPQEYDTVNIVDWEDLKILSEHNDCSEYKPIPLTEEWLKKIKDVKKLYANIWVCGEIRIVDNKVNWKICMFDGHGLRVIISEIKFLHELQNIIKPLTKKELQFK